MLSFEEFLKIDVRVGEIVSAEHFERAKKPAYILKIDFGEKIGIRKSSAQITENYSVDDLPGKQILAVVNFPNKQIGPIMSEVLVLGVPDEYGNVVLIGPEREVPLNVRIY